MTDPGRLTNEELEQLITGEVPGALTPEQAADVAVLTDLLATSAAWAEPSAGLEDAVVLAVMDAEPADDSVDDLAPRRRRVRPRAFAAASAAAAVVALVVGLAVVRNEEHADFKGNLVAAAVAPGVQTSTGLANDPNAPPASNARASIEMYKSDAGFRVSLDPRGLAALPPGEYYEAWVKNAAGTVVPIGTFSSGKGEVTLWSGVSPKDFSTVTVTIEPADNDPGPSGRRVLSGVLHPN